MLARLVETTDLVPTCATLAGGRARRGNDGPCRHFHPRRELPQPLPSGSCPEARQVSSPTSLLLLELLPQHRHLKRVSLFTRKAICGPRKRSSWVSGRPLSHLQTISLVFTAGCYGDASSLCWFPGLGSLEWGCDCSLLRGDARQPRYPS